MQVATKPAPTSCAGSKASIIKDECIQHSAIDRRPSTRRPCARHRSGVREIEARSKQVANYLHRLEKLEAEHAPPRRIRAFVSFVNMQREVETLFAEGQWFHRAEGDSEEEFKQRARRALGWDD